MAQNLKDIISIVGKEKGKNGGGVGILVRNDVLNKTAPHISDRNIEMMWVSLRTKAGTPTNDWSLLWPTGESNKQKRNRIRNVYFKGSNNGDE